MLQLPELTIERWRIIYAVTENIHILPTEGFFLHHSPLPQGNSSVASYFASKILTFESPLPQGISDDLPWGGYEKHVLDDLVHDSIFIFKCKWQPLVGVI